MAKKRESLNFISYQGNTIKTTMKSYCMSKIQTASINKDVEQLKLSNIIGSNKNSL